MILLDPDRIIVDNYEVLSFSNTQTLNYYSLWDDSLREKLEQASNPTQPQQTTLSSTRNNHSRNSAQRASQNNGRANIKANISTLSSVPLPDSSLLRVDPSSASTSPAKSSIHTKSPLRQANIRVPPIPRTPAHNQHNHPIPKSKSSRTSANQYGPFVSKAIGNYPIFDTTVHLNNNNNPSKGLFLFKQTLAVGDNLMRHKMNKVYNKYRNRQLRFKQILDKSRHSLIEQDLNKCILNSWLSYTALQTLAPNINNNNNKINFAIPNNNTSLPLSQGPNTSATTTNTNNQSVYNIDNEHLQPLQQILPSPSVTSVSQPNSSIPIQLMYIDPSRIVNYSNRINPRQIAEYRKRAHKLPSVAMSKKSSAASYDVYEIMQVLANTTKTNVTITRNAHRPSQQQNQHPQHQQSAIAASLIAAGAQQINTNNNTPSTASVPKDKDSRHVYSHSVNPNTPGIVSTQLHIQAKSYVDSLSRLYADEMEKIEREKRELDESPCEAEIVDTYFNHIKGLTDDRMKGNDLFPQPMVM